MDAIREYVIQVTATALICAVVFRLARGSGGTKMIIRLLCGIVLSCSIIQPVKQLEFSPFEELNRTFRQEADRAVEQGKIASAAAWADSITQGVEAYILEKTKAMHLDMIVEVELADDEVPTPVGVRMVGKVAPYAKSVLSDMIEQDLNIPKEQQIWISQ